MLLAARDGVALDVPFRVPVADLVGVRGQLFGYLRTHGAVTMSVYGEQGQCSRGRCVPRCSFRLVWHRGWRVLTGQRHWFEDLPNRTGGGQHDRERGGFEA